MFEHKFAQSNHFTSKSEGSESFRQWCVEVGIHPEQFPFSVKTGRMFKEKPIVHHVTSWGHYTNADGNYRVFVAYRYNPMKHTTQYTWAVNEMGMIDGDPAKYEWIGG